jgi:hypothetical protein
MTDNNNPLTAVSEAVKQRATEAQMQELINQVKDLNKKFDLIIQHFGITSTSRYIR